MCAGMDVVFHCATMAPSAENATSKALAYAVNVRGTENVIQACQSEGVPKLVYTSSASVVFDGRDLNHVDETAPYAVKPLDYYTQTKVRLALHEHCSLCHSRAKRSGTESYAQVLWQAIHGGGKGGRKFHGYITVAMKPTLSPTSEVSTTILCYTHSY